MWQSSEANNTSFLAENMHQVIGQGFYQIAHHRPRGCREKSFNRHARNQLLALELTHFLFLNDDQNPAKSDTRFLVNHR